VECRNDIGGEHFGVDLRIDREADKESLKGGKNRIGNRVRPAVGVSCGSVLSAPWR
jgi:hypothetical protein